MFEISTVRREDWDFVLDKVPIFPSHSADLEHVTNFFSCCLHLQGSACSACWAIIHDGRVLANRENCMKVQAAGEEIGDMFEISTVRREDWDFVQDKSGEFVSVLQCNNAPSSRTPRGHQS